MPTPTFPAYAKLLYEGFKEDAENGVRRTDMEGGPPKQSKHKSRVLVTQSMVVRLESAADYASFKAWHKTDIAYGALWFNRTDPVTAATVLSRIKGGKLGERTPVRKQLDRWHIPVQIEFWDS